MASVTALESQLRKAQLDLVEVIDEVVFAENGQRKAENDLKMFQQESGKREATLTQLVDNLVDYVLILENNILLPSVGAQTFRSNFEVSKARLIATDRLQTVSDKFTPLKNYSLPSLQDTNETSSDASLISLLRKEHAMMSFRCKSAQRLLEEYLVSNAMRLADAFHETVLRTDNARLSAEIDFLSERLSEKEISSVPAEFAISRSEFTQSIEQLKKRIDDLTGFIQKPWAGCFTSDTDESTHAAQSSVHIIKLLRSEISDLRLALDEERRSHTSIANKLKKRCQRLQSQVADAEKPCSFEGSQRDYLAKIKAFELTIHTLNSELAVLESNMFAAETKHVQEIQASQMELQLERRDRRAEREEYDAMLNRVTTEIEALMKENVELKQRIRQFVE